MTKVTHSQNPITPSPAAGGNGRSVSAVKPTPAPAVQAPASRAQNGFRPAAFPPTARVIIVAEGNPKRPGSKAHKAWGAYTDGKGKTVTTVADAMARFKELGFPQRYARSALRWDSGHGFIKIEDAKTA